MKLPDDGTTMINISSKSVSLWDVICKVAEKKNYTPGDYIILAEKGSRKLKPDLSETLESYLDYDLKLISGIIHYAFCYINYKFILIIKLFVLK